MKLQDKETLNVADAVKNVLEGKVKKEEVKYPHMMYSPDGKDEVEVKDKAEHDKFAEKGYVHKKPDVKEVDEPNKPSGKLGPQTGERDFKGKHSKKVSGMKPDGTNMKEEDEKDDEVTEGKKPGRGKSTIDVDYIGSKKDAAEAQKKHKLKIKMTGRGQADISGEKKDIMAYLSSDAYGMDSSDIEELFPELFEDVKETSEKQKKYQAFFQKALKKFGVKSPAELEGDKKKEFYDYVDKNYEADNETD